jgi:hypothetical protein
MNISHREFSAHFPDENPEQLMETFATLKEDVYHRSCTNAILFNVIRCISDELKTPFELVKEMLVPGFGTKAFLDCCYDRLKKMSPDEFVQILLRIKQSCETLKGCFKTAHAVAELGGLHSDGIKSKADIALAVNRLQDIILNAEYLNTDHPLMTAVMFYDVSELESLFFIDTAKLTQGALKHPELYMGVRKSSGRKTRKPAIVNIPDSARLYKLTLEWQRMINLHDLYLQFQSQIHAEPRRPKPDQQEGYMARFMQCVNELELVGVWSSLGRKRDTYERRNFTDAPEEDPIGS